MDPFQVLLASEDFKDFRNSSPSLLEQSRVVRAGHLQLTALLRLCVGLGQLANTWSCIYLGELQVWGLAFSLICATQNGVNLVGSAPAARVWGGGWRK